MKSTKPNHKRVLAIDPTSRGFGFVVLESPTTLVDWGVKAIRPQKEGKVLAKVSELIRHYRPEIIVLEDHRRSRRCARIQNLLDGICRLATAEGLKSRCVPVSRVKKIFCTFRANTKHEIAHAVAQQLPELAPRVPRYRKPWMSEDYRMAIFDAAALALTYFYSRQVRSNRGQKPLPESPNSLPASNSV
jgi:Holliday junction resolvasome RuvABC endonuclease subunit